MVDDRDERAALGGRTGERRRRNLLPLIIGGIILIALLVLLLRGCSEMSDTDYGATGSPPGETTGAEPDAEALPATGAAPAGTADYVRGDLGRYLAGADPLPRSYALAGVTFASGSAELDEAASEEIADVAAALRGRPSARVSLRGFADPEGDAEANQALSQDRAQAVRDALIAAGADESQIEIAPLGETGDEAARQFRRVELNVTAR